ncbi:MAG: ACP S-malonyltransferase, partial [Armatimonadetes bacterium]|nr:ACP S-malonyltransferase [Armatimonadota bacterium]
MGVALADAVPAARAVFSRAGAALGEDLLHLCRAGPEEALRQTENTQPAILAASVACLVALRQHGVDAGVAAGLSLGEYTALVAAGAMRFEDAVVLVRKRGRFMQETAAERDTAMAAVLGLDPEGVAAACREAAGAGIVEPSSFNGPGQVVIGGDSAAVERAAQAARARGARRVVRLAVSAPFHTSLMQPAALRLAGELTGITLRDPRIPVVANATAEPVTEAGRVREFLITQVASPVRWEESVRRMAAMGARAFVEVGPGTSLSGMIKKIVEDAVVLHVEDPASLRETVDRLQ